MDELYAVGWTPGLPRQWVVAVYPSVTVAAAAAGGYARFDGGGPVRVTAPNAPLTAPLPRKGSS